MGGISWVGRVRAEISFKIGLDAAQIVLYYQGVPLELDADASASAGRGAHGRRPAASGVRRVAHKQLHRDVGPHVQNFLLDVRRFASILPKRASSRLHTLQVARARRCSGIAKRSRVRGGCLSRGQGPKKDAESGET